MYNNMFSVQVEAVDVSGLMIEMLVTELAKFANMKVQIKLFSLFDKSL